jgi:type IV secretory pathway VirB10-like protein
MCVSLYAGVMPSGSVFASTKIKPDLPIGEEIHEPAAPPAKKSKPAEPAITKGQKSQPSTAGTDSDKNAKSKQPADQSKAGAHQDSSDHATGGEEADPYAAPHKTAGDGAAPHAKGTAPDNSHQSDSHNSVSASAHDEESGKLLEGKVAPATPAKGSGFVWFAVVFALLAIAIFIFT